VAVVHRCLSVGFRCGVCPQLFVGFLCPQLFVFYTQKTNRQTTVDKRHTENQQTNNFGQTPHRKPIEKQLSTNTTQKTNRERTVDKHHTENQQRNNCGQTPHRKPTIKSTLTPLKEGIKDKQLWTKRHTENQQTNNCGQTSHRKSTEKQLWTNVSVGFCDVCPQLFVCWFSVWRLSTVVCLLVSMTFVHSCLSVDFLCDVTS
jgi:hypothetical protein